MVYRSWQILKNDNPVVQTSMSETWGEFPTFQCCDIRMHGKPRLQLCSLTQLEQPEGKHDPGKDSSFQTFQCMHNTGKIRYMKSAWSKEHGHCFLVEMRSFSPNATVEHPSKVMLQFSLPVFHEEGQYGEGRLNLFAAEPNQKLQTLASLYPGNSDLLLTKVKTGSISLFNDPFSWKTWKNAVFPNLKSVYTTNLQAFGPDHGVFKQKLVKKKLIDSKWQPVVSGDVTFQNYKLTLSVNTQHAEEQVEIDQLAQILFLMARVGGWMSVLTAILGFFWVQKNTDPCLWRW